MVPRETTRADVRPEHVALLNDVERRHRDRYLRDEDRDRFTLGVVVIRLALAPLLGIPPERVPLSRTCQECGEPHGPQQSVSHSAEVAVALSTAGPVGVDVEAVRPLDEAIERRVLAPAEELDGGELPAYWTRKEARRRATGCTSR